MKLLNEQLASYWQDVLWMCKAVRKNGLCVYANTRDSEYPKELYWIDIEEYTFYYEKKSERDLDFSKILQYFVENKYCYTKAASTKQTDLPRGKSVSINLADEAKHQHPNVKSVRDKEIAYGADYHNHCWIKEE